MRYSWIRKLRKATGIGEANSLLQKGWIMFAVVESELPGREPVYIMCSDGNPGREIDAAPKDFLYPEGEPV